MEDVVVIGAGLAGLTAAHRLLRQGRQVKCLEANERAGGCVRTDQIDGYRCERGAQNFLEEANGPVHRLAAELGIDRAIQPADEIANYLAWNDRVWNVPRQLPRIVSVKGLCRAALETCLPRAAGSEDESVGDWARRRFGAEVAQRLIDPMISGIYAADPNKLSLQAAFSVGAELEREHRSVILGAFKSKPARRGVYSFANGMETLPGALAQALGPALYLRTTAFTVHGENGGYRIETRTADGNANASLTTREVVFATPAPTAARLAAGLDAALADLLNAIPYAPLVSIWLAFLPSDFLGAPPKGYGLIRPYCEGSRNLGCLYCSSMFNASAPSERVLLRLMFGGRRDPEACALSQPQLVALARWELDTVLGIDAQAQPVFVHRAGQQPGLPQYEVGHVQRLQEIDARLQQLPGVHLVGNAYRGVAVGKVIDQAERSAVATLAGRCRTH